MVVVEFDMFLVCSLTLFNHSAFADFVSVDVSEPCPITRFETLLESVGEFSQDSGDFRPSILGKCSIVTVQVYCHGHGFAPSLVVDVFLIFGMVLDSNQDDVSEIVFVVKVLVRFDIILVVNFQNLDTGV